MSNNSRKKYTITEKALFDDELMRGDLRVYMVLRLKISECKRTKTNFAPSTAELALELGMHARSLQRSLERLEKRGYITRPLKNIHRYILMK